MKSPSRPALLGGQRAFPTTMPLARPSLPDPDSLLSNLHDILRTGQLTNGRLVAELEEAVAERLDVAHCVAVSSCTSGLMLTLRAAGITGAVVVPAFTFAATVHAAAWNGNDPVFADINQRTLTLDAAEVDASITDETGAVLATHIYGTPCDVETLEEVTRSRGVSLFFDAAHALGSLRKGTPIGRFGDAEVFSLTPTKPVVAGEGGLISTNDQALAEQCKIGRDYGNPGDYDCRFIGLNARMSEMHAAFAIASLRTLDERLDRRNEIADLYRRLLLQIEGISLPAVEDGDRSTFKDFTILVDQDRFGLSATELGRMLRSEGIETRRYYAPPVHRMTAYSHLRDPSLELPVTEGVAQQVLTLPLWEEMHDGDATRISEVIATAHEFATELRPVLPDN